MNTTTTINNNTNENNMNGGITMTATTTTNNNNNMNGGITMTTNNTTAGTTTQNIMMNGDVNMTATTTMERFVLNAATSINRAYGLSTEIATLADGIGYKAKDIVAARHLFSAPKRYSIMDVTLNMDNNGVLSGDSRVIALSENRAFVTTTTSAAVVKTMKNGMEKSVFVKENKNFTSKFIQVSFQDKFLAKKFRGEKFNIYFDANAGSMFVKEKDGYRNILIGEFVAILPKTVELYKMLLFTAGDAKKDRALYFRVDFEFETAQLWNQIMNPGSLDKMAAEVSKKVAAKVIAQIGMIKTSGKMSETIENAVIFHTLSLDESGASDGTAIENALHAMKVESLVSEEEAVMTATQHRMGSAQKSTTKVMFNAEFKVSLRYQLSRVNFTKLTKVVLDNNTVEYYNVKNELVITVIGDVDAAEFIFDKNTTKLAVDYVSDTNRGRTIMAFAHDSVGKLNSQVVESIMYEACRQGKMTEAKAFFQDLMEYDLANLFENVLSEEAKLPGMESNYALDVLTTVRPNHNMVAQAKLSSGVNTIMNATEGLSFHTRFEDGSVSCFNFLLQSDSSALIGRYRIIADGFVFNAMVARRILKAKNYALDMQDMFGSDAEITVVAIEDYITTREDFDRAIITKAPKMGVGEYLNTHFMDYDEVDAAIELLNAPNGVKELLRKDFRFSPDGVIYFPSNVLVYAKLAGSDNDGDKVQVYFDKFMVGLLNRDIMVTIKTDAVRQSVQTKKLSGGIASKMRGSVKYNNSGELVDTTMDVRSEEAMYNIFMMNVENEMNIGLITHYNNKVIAALCLAYLGDTTVARHILDECGLVAGTEDRAFNVNDTVVDVNFADAIKVEMTKIVWTTENIIAFLEALNKVFRLYQEGAIDAAKTGQFIKIIFVIGSVIIERLLGFSTVGFGINKRIVRNAAKGLELEAVVNDEGGNFVKKMPKLFVSDPIAVIENELVTFANEQIDIFVNDNMSSFRYSQTEEVAFTERLLQTKREYPEVLSELYIAKKLYSSKVAEKAIALQELDADDNFGAESIREDYKETFTSISNHVRKLLSKLEVLNYTDMQKAELLLGVGASYRAEEIDVTSSNKFAYVVCPEFSYSYFTGGIDYVCESRIISKQNAIEGDTITLSRGISSDTGLLVNSRFSGEVVVSGNSVLAQKSFDRLANDDTTAILVLNKDLTKVISANASIAIEGGVYLAADLTKSKTQELVDCVVKSFTGEEGLDYYVDSCSTVSIKTRVGNDYAPVNHTVLFLSRV